jgi:hypothetical protein
VGVYIAPERYWTYRSHRSKIPKIARKQNNKLGQADATKQLICNANINKEAKSYFPRKQGK